MTEIWQPVKGFEGLYEVSNIGRVRSLKRATTSGRCLKQEADKDGYMRLTLSKAGVPYLRSVHRLVAEAFCKNPMELPYVNHKNEDKADNRAENLEWCTAQYNTTYKGAHIRRMAYKRVPIIAYNERETKRFESIAEASRALNIDHGNICGCLQGRYGRKTAKGYMFKYA